MARLLPTSSNLQKRRKGKYIKDGRKKRSLLVLQFGDIFFYDCFVRKTGILTAVDAIGYSNKDTLHSLLCYYVTSSEPNCRAEFWYNISYAKAFYPMATMASQRISDALAEIGFEENRRLFYHKYIEFVTGCCDFPGMGTLNDNVKAQVKSPLFRKAEVPSSVSRRSTIVQKALNSSLK